LPGLALAAELPLPPPQPPPAPNPIAEATGYAALPQWPGEAPVEALAPFLGTCQALRGWGADRPLGGSGEIGRLGGQAAHAAEACAAAARLADTLRTPPRPGRRPPAAATLARQAAAREAMVRRFLERHFQPFAVGTGLLTGYYEPELRGAEYPTGPYLVPLHAPPPGGQPMPDRAAIEAGALDGKGLELVFVDDPVDAFFLHIQGSGRVALHDGRVLRLGYAGQNGHPYRAIGRSLIERGAVPRELMSMQAIRDWLWRAEPGAAAALLRENASYIFFRPVEGLRPEEGPPGALGVPLTPGRSIAIDPAFIPYGALVYLVTRDPVDGTPIHRLVHAQDTGGAIRGAARGDLFWGWGEAATTRAGLMREEARLFVLVPRGTAPVQEAAHAVAPTAPSAPRRVAAPSSP
jgi:membrane-bound lytic murein transglycosylase A